MSDVTLPILSNPAVAERTSPATRRALEERSATLANDEYYLSSELYALLEQITRAMLPQDVIGTSVDIAAAIDKKLLKGTGAGWRFAELPEDGEAYKRGLVVFSSMLLQTPMKTFDRMPPPAREGYLRCVANGDVDGQAQFPLSRWLTMLRMDAVKIWMAHPAVMETMEYYGFADGETGGTNGPTEVEGWSALTPNQALPFEHGIGMPAGMHGAAEREA